MQAALLAALVVVAGQSNALGFHVAPAEAPADARAPDPTVRIWTGRRFETMRPGVNTGTPANPTAWGPEVGFARAWRRDHPGEPLFIVKSVKGSTALAADPHAADWSPSSRAELFDRTAALAASARARTGLPVSAVVWMQGEEDATDARRAAAYGDNLAGLFRAMRTRWGDGRTRIVVGRIGAAANLPYAGQVRAAQATAAAADPNAALVDTDALPVQPDRLHLNGAGQAALGAAFYRAVFSPSGAGRP